MARVIRGSCYPWLYPPAIAPTTRKGSRPVATASGSGVSGGSWDRSCSQAKYLHERSALVRDVVPNRATEDGIGRLERVEHRALRHFAVDADRDLAVHLRERPQVRRKDHSDHDKCLRLDRHDRWEIADDRRPAIAGIRRAVNLPAGGAEVDPAFIERVDRHGVPEHIDVAVALRQTLA